MTDDQRPIAYCPKCDCDVVTLPDGRCQWCLLFLVSHAQPRKQRYRARFKLVDRRRRRRPDGLCAACGMKPARGTDRTRCTACEAAGLPALPIGHVFTAEAGTRAYPRSDSEMAS